MTDMPVLDEADDPASSSFHALLRNLWDQHNKDLRELREKLTASDGQHDSIITPPSLPDVSTDAMAIQSKHKDDQGETGVAALNSLTTHVARTDSQKLNDGGVVNKKTIKNSVAEQHQRVMSHIFRLELDHAQGKLGEKTLFQRLQLFLQSNIFEAAVTILLTLNVAFMATESQIEGTRIGYDLEFYAVNWPDDAAWPGVQSALRTIDTGFTVVFLLDVILRIVVLRLKFWCVIMNYIDFIVVVASVLEFFADKVSLPVNLMILRLLRLGKLARALRMITMSKVLESLKLLVKCITASFTMLFWSFCLLTFIQCLAGMVVSNLAKDYMENAYGDKVLQREVFQFYGTFTRTFLTMYEVLFANWAPACRVLVNNVNENFMYLFLLYRCVVGFAVLNVVNAVFVQQTLKVAHSDEELAFKSKIKEKNKYSQMLKRLFHTADLSGDGFVSMDEFEVLLGSPKMRFWMAQLELEYYDMMGLFELLDDGDGKISLDEFTDGALRLKGGAKSVDVWRLENKLEDMLKQVLQMNSHMTGELGNVRNLLTKADILVVHPI